MRLKIFCEDPHKILRFVRISLSSHSAEDEPLNEPFRTRVPEVLLQAMADASEAFLRTLLTTKPAVESADFLVPVLEPVALTPPTPQTAARESARTRAC